ncbi:hypothetical protein CPC08DRAFT_649265 [Agrocybe pediades]|nr:hypothetical protein CPC08DRAFT_649265 [Agrocybe pediades]
MGYERDEREHGGGRGRRSGSGFGVASTSTSGSGSGFSSNGSLSSRTTPTPVAATSSATLNSILTTTVSTPVIPSKRKAELAGDTENREFRPSPGAPFSHHQQRLSSPPPISISNSQIHSTQSQTTSLHDYGNNPSTSNAATDLSTEPIDCMCGSSFDDGFSIACDRCGRWCHYVCFGIRQGNVPEDFLCWVCLPRPEELRRRASLIQMQQREASKSFAALGVGRRQTSPGNERRRRPGGVHPESMSPVVHTGGGKRKRRPSVNPEVDDSWAQTYVHIHEDIIASEETRQRLRKQAQDWRGVTAVAVHPSSSSPSTSTPNPDAAPIKIKQLPPQTAYNPHLLPTSNPDILPPTYTVHTTQPIPTEHLITPYTSFITPSSQYLADPLNAYAHLGMPKPYVHLVGRPLAVALDARGVGGKGRFVRSGCRPNAVIRPVLCSKKSKSKGKEKQKDNGGDQEEREEEEEERMLSFGVFALRDLKADEEVVLGWEWDDGNVVHRLPALLSAPRMFP